MRIEVRRTGGFAGTTRRWRVDTDSSSDPTAWSEVVDALQRTPAPTAAPVPDDFSWTITVERTTVTIPGRRLDGPWADLVARVRSEGDPT